MFEIEMLPAREGDCLWIRYGPNTAPKQLLIDGGRTATHKVLRERLLDLPKSQRKFELFVITHVDRDHIEGAMELLEDLPLGTVFGQVWFNGYDHLIDAPLEEFGAVQGERVTAALLGIRPRWNRRWKGRAVVLDGKRLPTAKLNGGLTLRVLSPDRRKLEALAPQWERECRAAGLVPGSRARRDELEGIEEFGAINVESLAVAPFVPDTTRPNGSSIALLAEYRGKRALLAADAHVDRLLESLRVLAGRRRRVRVDVFKVSHHGSEGNISRELLEAVDCPLYLISTNGSYFKHPKAVAIARILKYGKPEQIAFNYRSKFTTLWNAESLTARYRYRAVYPDKANNGTLAIRLA